MPEEKKTKSLNEPKPNPNAIGSPPMTIRRNTINPDIDGIVAIGQSLAAMTAEGRQAAFAWVRQMYPNVADNEDNK